MKMSDNVIEPTVSEYYDFTENGKGELRKSSDFFKGKYTPRSDKGYFFEMRRISESVFFCGLCGKPLKIKGGGEGDKKKMYFSHRAGEGENCPYHDKCLHPTHEQINRYKYHGQRVGLKHEEIKHFITYSLNGMTGITAVEEKVMRSEIEDFESVWKKPDITAVFNTGSINNDKPFKMVFEIQLSTTFFEVIKSREQFYKDNQVYIMWVFDDTFSPKEQKQNFAQMDVLAGNNHNAFVLDQEAKTKTQETGILHFTCYYNYYEIIKGKVACKVMKKSLVSLDQLTFDENFFKVFYVDVNSQKDECNRQLKQYHEDEKLLKFSKITNDTVEDGNELLNRQTKQEFEALIRKYYTIELKRRMENASEREIGILIEAYRSFFCDGQRLGEKEIDSFNWLISNSSKFGIYADDIIKNKEEFESFLNKGYPLYFIQGISHWLFSSFDTWVMNYCDKESFVDIWEVVRNNNEDKDKRACYAIWFMYLRVACSRDNDILKKLDKEWYLFMGFISIYCESGLHNNQRNIKSVLFDMINIHPDYSHLLIKLLEKKTVYLSMRNRKNQSVSEILEEKLVTVKQRHELDDLAYYIFPKVFYRD